MDGPNMNLKFYQELIKKKKEQLLFHSLLDIESCHLHIIHGSFKTGAEKSNRNIKELLKSVFQLLHNLPDRRKGCESITALQNICHILFNLVRKTDLFF